MFSLYRKKQVATERDMAAAGKVSIWIGDFTDEDSLLAYIEGESEFGAEFGCVLRSRREITVCAEAKPLRELLEGFSSWRDFIDEAVATREEESARCAVVAYACDYSLLGKKPAVGRLRFVCVASADENKKRA